MSPLLFAGTKYLTLLLVQADVATSIEPAHFGIAQCVVMVFAWQAHCDCLCFYLPWLCKQSAMHCLGQQVVGFGQ